MSLKVNSERLSPKSQRALKHRGQKQVSRKSTRFSLQTGGVLLSLAGVLACNYLGLGLGRVVCHGLLVASLGAPAHRPAAVRAQG